MTEQPRILVAPVCPKCFASVLFDEGPEETAQPIRVECPQCGWTGEAPRSIPWPAEAQP